MKASLFETLSDEEERSAPFPLATVFLFVVLFAAIAAYMLGPK